ncbi:hypothetical protein KM043_016769 [Ampulex compressa]|nr:hypothetical protein KM043_016769 [Ampulex compressa]
MGFNPNEKKKEKKGGKRRRRKKKRKKKKKKKKKKQSAVRGKGDGKRRLCSSSALRRLPCEYLRTGSSRFATGTPKVYISGERLGGEDPPSKTNHQPPSQATQTKGKWGKEPREEVKKKVAWNSSLSSSYSGAAIFRVITRAIRNILSEDRRGRASFFPRSPGPARLPGRVYPSLDACIQQITVPASGILGGGPVSPSRLFPTRFHERTEGCIAPWGRRGPDNVHFARRFVLDRRGGHHLPAAIILEWI